MSDHESLGEASWAAGLLSEQDWLELQSTGTAIVAASAEPHADKFFYLYISRQAHDAKRLVEAYAAVNNDDPTVEQSTLLYGFLHEIMSWYYSMCVQLGIVDVGFWKQPGE